MKNPFTPAFGVVPYILAGRDVLLEDMAYAFDAGLGDPNLATLLVGARGTGKTALLARIREIAQEHGWLAVGTTALPGMLEDIEEQTRIAAAHIIDPSNYARISSISLGPVGASWEKEDESQGNWRTRMTLLLEELKTSETGLLITVDEVQANLKDMIVLAAVYQHFVTENRQVALVMAGLPFQAHQLVTNKSVSFLRRAALKQLGPVTNADVAAAIKETVAFGGKAIRRDALELCTEAILGFPYMLQLVGYRTWAASGNQSVIEAADAEQGVKLAEQEFEERVLAATYRELSDVDRRFLLAMLDDKRESRLADISRRMGVKSNYASKYKMRLLAQGVIDEVGNNAFVFSIPGIREYLTQRLQEDDYHTSIDKPGN